MIDQTTRLMARTPQLYLPQPSVARLGAMAQTLCDDGYLPIADRVFAFQISHRLRLHVVISDRDALRLRQLYAQHRDQLTEAVSVYGQHPC
jgi:hypothetical protein